MADQKGVPINQDKFYLRGDQYLNSQNLNARAQLHRRYSTNNLSWQEWLLSFLAIDGESTILDCGCGPGYLWRGPAANLLEGCRIVLLDLSEGMVREAHDRLDGQESIVGYQVADALALPFASGSFNVVVANHMLYHVPARNMALREIKRVLKVGGRLIASTNGKTHLRELRAVGAKLLPDLYGDLGWADHAFSLENGAAQLREVFSAVELRRFHNQLQVTDAGDILAYLLSSSEARDAVQPEKVERTRAALAERITAEGAFQITTDSGLFLARRES